MFEELTHVLTDPAHWVAEVVMDGTLTLLAVLPIRALVRRHDRKRHPIPIETVEIRIDPSIPDGDAQ